MRKALSIAASFALAAGAAQAQEAAAAEPDAMASEMVVEFAIPEANQGIGVDASISTQSTTIRSPNTTKPRARK